MKKFKLLTLVFAIVMVFVLLAGCGNKEDKSDMSNIVNDDGEKLNVDVSKHGKIKEDSKSINSDQLELAGTTYTFPIKMSEMFNNGWNLEQGHAYQTEFEANKKYNLISYYLVHESGMRIDLSQIINEANEEKDIKECLLTGLSIWSYDVVNESDYILPGGIMPVSTVADILDVFGNPNKTTDFTGYSYNLEQQLTYDHNAKSSISYSFSFNEDGTIYSVRVDYAE